MTTLNEVRGAIYTAFVAAWGATSALTLDNEDFSPPEGLPWARLVVRHATRGQESLGGVGNRKFETVGTVIVQCFGPLESGTKETDTLVEKAMSILEGVTLSPEGIHFTGATPVEIGPGEDHYQVNVNAAFSWTETK